MYFIYSALMPSLAADGISGYGQERSRHLPRHVDVPHALQAVVGVQTALAVSLVPELFAHQPLPGVQTALARGRLPETIEGGGKGRAWNTSYTH